MKPRVGIVSLFGLYNFGNRLQGYAVDSLYKAAGTETTTLVFYRKLGLSVLKEHVRLALLRTDPRAKRRFQRQQRFEEFLRGQEIDFLWSPSQVGQLHRRFEWFVAGSDQVWHPEADLYPGTKFLEFARSEQRIALAPSLGINELPETLQTYYRTALNGFPKISVRESEGADLIKKVSGQEAIVLADPTIGIGREEWLEAARLGSRPTSRYVLLYFLGGTANSTRRVIDEIASRLNLGLVDLLDGESDYWASGPQDFLSLISGANLVLTDSYHAAIFSSIFETPFYVFKREERVSTYSRIATLLDALDLRDREADRLDMRHLLEQDFTVSTKLLSIRQAEVVKYVQDSVQDA